MDKNCITTSIDGNEQYSYFYLSNDCWYDVDLATPLGFFLITLKELLAFYSRLLVSMWQDWNFNVKSNKNQRRKLFWWKKTKRFGIASQNIWKSAVIPLGERMVGRRDAVFAKKKNSSLTSGDNILKTNRLTEKQSRFCTFSPISGW